MSIGLAKYDFGSPSERAILGPEIIGRQPETGLPVRGRQDPMLRGREHDTLPRVCDFHSKMFRLWVEEEHREYNQICDRIANGLFKMARHREIVVPNVPGQGPGGEPGEHFKIWLEWVQVYVTVDGQRDSLPRNNGVSLA